MATESKAPKWWDGLRAKGVVPPEVVDWALDFPLGKGIRVTYTCWAPPELLHEMGFEVASDKEG